MTTVLLFAGARKAAGTGRMTASGSTAGEVIDAIVRQVGPELLSLLPHCSVMVDGVRVTAPMSVPVTDASEIAILPPVSGGCH